jgi:hypothetical protein
MMPTAIANNIADQLMRFEPLQANLEFLTLFLHQRRLTRKNVSAVVRQHLGQHFPNSSLTTQLPQSAVELDRVFRIVISQIYEHQSQITVLQHQQKLGVPEDSADLISGQIAGGGQFS